MPPICHEGTWKAQFERLWELRLLWNPAVERDRRTFKISVAARLCPLRSVGGGAEGAEPDEAAGPRVTVGLLHNILCPRAFAVRSPVRSSVTVSAFTTHA